MSEQIISSPRFTSGTTPAAITLHFCYDHQDYQGAVELARDIRRYHFTDDIFKPFPEIHPEILRRFHGYRVWNSIPVLQFYVNEGYNRGLIGIYLFGVNLRVDNPYPVRHGKFKNTVLTEVRVMGFDTNGRRVEVSKTLSHNFTNHKIGIYELGVDIDEINSEEELWEKSDDNGVPLFNYDQGELVLLDRKEAPFFEISALELLTPWYNVITRQPLNPSGVDVDSKDRFESDQYYHNYYISKRKFHIETNLEMAQELWDNGIIVSPPTNPSGVREGLGKILGPFDVTEVWKGSKRKPIVSDADVTELK